MRNRDRRAEAIEDAYAYCVSHDRWPDGFFPFDAIRFLLEERRAYVRALSAHHELSTLSEAAIRESIGGDCQVCARARNTA